MERFKISIAGFLLFVTFCALAVSHVLTSRELTMTKAELSQLRDRVGLIQVKSGRLAARRLPSSDDTTWKWTVKLPETGSHALRLEYASTERETGKLKSSVKSKFIQLRVDELTKEGIVIMHAFYDSQFPDDAEVILGHDMKKEIIEIPPDIGQLLVGMVPCRTEFIGDKPRTSLGNNRIELFRADPIRGAKIWVSLTVEPTRIDGE